MGVGIGVGDAVGATVNTGGCVASGSGSLCEQATAAAISAAINSIALAHLKNLLKVSFGLFLSISGSPFI